MAIEAETAGANAHEIDLEWVTAGSFRRVGVKERLAEKEKKEREKAIATVSISMS